MRGACNGSDMCPFCMEIRFRSSKCSGLAYDFKEKMSIIFTAPVGRTRRVEKDI